MDNAQRIWPLMNIIITQQLIYPLNLILPATELAKNCEVNIA